MKQLEKGLIGNPKFDVDDMVHFEIIYDGKPQMLFGRVWIVDRNGTFEQHEEPSYDIMVNNWLNSGQDMFFKHIRESWCFEED